MNRIGETVPNGEIRGKQNQPAQKFRMNPQIAINADDPGNVVGGEGKGKCKKKKTARKNPYPLLGNSSYYKMGFLSNLFHESSVPFINPYLRVQEF